MKKFFVILAIVGLSATVPAKAQLNFGIKAGVNLTEKPTLNVDDLKASIKGNSGWFVGPTAKYIFPVIGLGLEANLLYSQTNIEIEEQNVTSQYVDLPVYLRYELALPAISKFLVPFVAAGPQFSWNIGEKSITLDNIADIVSSEYKLKESNIRLNLGLGFTIFDQLQLHGNYNLALGKTADITGSILDFSKELAELKTNTWQISLAYIF